MAASGQKRSFVNYRVCPDSTGSSDHPIGAHEKRLRDREAEGFGGLEIDDQFKFGRLLDRQLARLGALEYLVHEVRGAPVKVGDVLAVADQAAGLHILPK